MKTMGRSREVSRDEMEDNQQDMVLTCVRRERRNGMGNIFEGVDAQVQQKFSGLSVEMVQQLMSDTVAELDGNTISDCLPELVRNRPDSTSSASTSSSLVSPDNHSPCQQSRMRRSISATVGDEMRAALQNRQRRNAVGNLFDVLSPSQKLLLVEHLQEQMERLQALHADATGDKSQVILTLSDLSSSSTSSSGSSTVSSPRSQGEIVCR